MDTLNSAKTKETFDQWVEGLSKQHLRLKFKRRFGTGELLDRDQFNRQVVVTAKDKLATNLLHELPPHITVTRITGSAENLTAVSWRAEADASIQSLLLEEEIEQALVIHGKVAKAFVYSDPTEETVVSSYVTVPAPEPVAKPKRPVSRRQLAARGRTRRR